MEVTAGLAESNGSLLPGLWHDSLHVTCGLTACTPGSAPGPTLGNEYGKTLPLLYLKLVSTVINKQLQSHLIILSCPHYLAMASWSKNASTWAQRQADRDGLTTQKHSDSGPTMGGSKKCTHTIKRRSRGPYYCGACTLC